ncbi:MAG: alpha/beta hydrolase family protein [Anaerolineales bacterium]
MKHTALILSTLILVTLACSLAGVTPTPIVEGDSFFFFGRAYVDANGNGELDPGDPPLKGAAFSAADAGGASSGGFTGDDGGATAWWPGGSEYPVTLRMEPPEGYTAIGPQEVILEKWDSSADFLFAPAQQPQLAPETYWVANPTGGARLYVEVLRPQDWDGKTALPALILIPGGAGSSEGFKRPNRHAQELADAGYHVVLFDPDGRGQSEGQENQNGHTQQDGLAAVVWFVFDLRGVQRPHIALVSFSYGITMASGALARHPDLPIRFLIDWEGPADRTDTGGCDAEDTGHLRGVVSCDDEKFWAEREALTFIGAINRPYLRLQSEQDHVQPGNEHALKLVNAAIEGGVPWVRLNDLPPGQTYDPANPPPMIPEGRDRDLMLLLVRFTGEMLVLHGGE